MNYYYIGRKINNADAVSNNFTCWHVSFKDGYRRFLLRLLRRNGVNFLGQSAKKQEISISMNEVKEIGWNILEYPSLKETKNLSFFYGVGR